MWPWLALAVLAAIGELLSYDLFLASVAVAAILTAVVALAVPLAIQVAIFGALSLVGIAFIRPVLKRALGLEGLAQDVGGFSHSHLAGRRGIITQAVSANSGQIRIGDGEFWTARPFDPAESFAPGDAVEVLLVEGVTALVELVPGASREPPSLAALSTDSDEKGIDT
jgi:membrane protein implicated in regulation of membrane protease activity